MNLTLINSHRITAAFLPVEVSGKHWLEDKDKEGRTRRLASIEAHEGHWLMSPYGSTVLIADQTNGMNVTSSQLTQHARLQDLDAGISTHKLITSSGEQVTVLAEEDSIASRSFTKIGFSADCAITIGRQGTNTLIFSSQYVSGCHALLELDDETFTLTDVGSSNGVFVNGKAIPQHTPVKLHFGDALFIMGLKIITGKRFIAYNNPHGAVKLTTDKNQVRYTPQIPEKDQASRWEPQRRENFYRSPRIMREITPRSVVIEDPPAPKEQEDSPALLKIGPSLGMALASVLMGLYMVSNVSSGDGNIMRVLPMLGMIGVMILGAVLWPNLSRRYEKKKAEREESKRRAAYGAYLDSIRRLLQHEIDVQRSIYEENRITLAECLNRVAYEDRSLFDRTPGQTDYLEIRIGRGNALLTINLGFPTDKLTLDEDVLRKLLQDLRSQEQIIKDVPLSLPLSDDYVCGVVASAEDYYPFMRGLVAQICTLHAPDEVKIVYLGNEEHVEEWDFMRTLPHIFEDDFGFRYLACSLKDAQELSLRLERELQRRLAMSQVERPGDYGTSFVVIDARGPEGASVDILTSLTSLRVNKGFTVVTFAEDIRLLPKECRRIIELDGAHGISYDPKDASGARTEFTSDILLSREEAAQCGEGLAAISFGSAAQLSSLPRALGFLEMFEAGSVDHLNIQARWAQSNPTLSLAAPLGVDAQLNQSLLDVHEDAHGPHGLIAGMTGSGKSETIITYVLSLAVNYQPDEVSFVLIDYKGGGLAGAFDNESARLPHLAGTITNLDGSAITRSLVSINSELKKRQALFNAAREVAGTSTMDIYRYQRLCRQGTMETPCPHLFIIADEFAELKSQQPEFMDQLISTARIGRSLGVHLILATQKPSGVVNDQIWSNARFKICLKVADGADSREMLKRSDAAELIDAGRYYLMVGYNEHFSLGQSAWAGTPYRAKKSFEAPRDDTVVLVSPTARLLAQRIPAQAGSAGYSSVPESVAVLDHLVQVAAAEGLSAPRLWLDPLPERITVDALEEKYAAERCAVKKNPCILNPLVGELDNPKEQSQELLTLPLSQEGNALLYGATGSGKSTILASTLYSLCKDHTAETLNVYILDFGAETLGAFALAPQVGDVLFAGDEEKIGNLFKTLTAECLSRRKLLAHFGGSLSAYNKGALQSLPSIVVVINNYDVFPELYDRHVDDLLKLTRDGARCGLYFILSCVRHASVNYRLLPNFKQKFLINPSAKDDVIAVFGTGDGLMLPRGHARGLVKRERLLEFQGASISGTDDYEAICAVAKSLLEESPHQIKANPIRALPQQVDYLLFKDGVTSAQGVPLGLAIDDTAPVYHQFNKSPIMLLVSEDEERVVPFVNGLLLAFGSSDEQRPFVLNPEGYVLSQGKYTSAVEKEAIALAVNELSCMTKEDASSLIVIFLSFREVVDALDAEVKKHFEAFWQSGAWKNFAGVVVSGEPARLSKYTMELWYRDIASSGNGLWIGDGFSEQTILKKGRLLPSHREPIPETFGYYVCKNSSKLIKLLRKEEDG